MSKSLRLSEKWFNRSLWLVSIIFAWCLIGLGSAVIGDLPKVEKHLTVDDFYDKTQAQQDETQRSELANALKALETKTTRLTEAKQRMALNYNSASKDHSNWLNTRGVTDTAKDNQELIERMATLENLQQQLHASETALLEAQEERNQIKEQQQALDEQIRERFAVAGEAWRKAKQKADLRVFGYRLLLTLPLLILAFYLFKTQRGKPTWPFTRGFIMFALFAFFVELVPYLPSFGGYVRYGVGLLLTFFGGRYVIKSLQAYLARQREAEAQPEAERRQALAYDVVFQRLAQQVCPGCERSVPLQDKTMDFCPHCGIHLFDRCTACEARKNSFAQFCHACGEKAQGAEQPS